MGGGGSDQTTNVTNTGLGDDQYQTLADNQVGISGQIGTAREDATARYDSFDGRFGGLDTSVAGVGENLTSGFTNLQGVLDQYNTGMNTQFDAVNTGVAASTAAADNNTQALGTLQTDLTGGFSNLGGRFDTVDTNTTNIQSTVDQGLIDQAQGFTDAQANRTTQFDAAETSRAAGFEAAGQAFNEGFSDAAAQLNNTQADVLSGQNNLGTTLDTMQGTADIYAEQSLENQDALSSAQDGFVSTFDNYIERYGEDTTLANQTRSDMQLANSNANQKLREDIGSFAQAAATGQDTISGQIGTLEEGTAAGFDTLGSAVGTGFSDASMSEQQAAVNLTNRLGNVRDLISTSTDNLDAKTQAQYSKLFNSFDQNGALISNSIDENGLTLSRKFDDQGNIIETSFDAAGNQIGGVSMNVNTMLSNAESYQATLTGQIGQVGSDLSTGFTGAAGQVDQLGSDLSTGQQDVITGIEATSAGLDANLQQQYNALSRSMADDSIDIKSVLQNGFDLNSGTLNTNAKSLLELGSQVGTLDADLSGQFGAVSAAFDQQGNLIGNTTDELGNAVTNQLDAQGNLITTKFDAQGNQISLNDTNIQQVLFKAASVQDIMFGSLGTGQRGIMSNLDTQMQLQNNLADTNSNKLNDLGSNIDQGFASISSNQQDAYSKIDQSFNQQNNTLDTQTKNIAAVAANQTDIDQKNRNEFKQLSNAFDDQGKLITNTVNDNGTTISRAIDKNGNLLLRSFDMQGNRLGDQVININKSLYNLSQLDTYQGANISMGNLSPAMSQDAPSGGFTSPFATTR